MPRESEQNVLSLWNAQRTQERRVHLPLRASLGHDTTSIWLGSWSQDWRCQNWIRRTSHPPSDENSRWAVAQGALTDLRGLGLRHRLPSMAQLLAPTSGSAQVWHHIDLLIGNIIQVVPKLQNTEFQTLSKEKVNMNTTWEHDIYNQCRH